MRHIKFLFKAIIIYFKEEKRFNCKINYRCNKLANFWLDYISKINYKMLVVLLYTLLELESKRSNWSRKSLNILSYYYAADSELLLTLTSSPLNDS